eukprot:6178029-Pleurochrysis_carterae.AAC.1
MDEDACMQHGCILQHLGNCSRRFRQSCTVNEIHNLHFGDMELPQSPDSVLDAGDDTAATAPRYKDSAATAANADGWRMLVTLLNRLEAGCAYFTRQLLCTVM